MKLLTSLERVVQSLGLAMFAAMLLLTLAQVVFRYALHLPVPWTEEAARALFVLATLSGIALAWRRRQHIIVDFLFAAMPFAVQRGLSLLFGISILAFLMLWARGAIELAGRNWDVTLITIGWFRLAYYYIWELAVIGLLALYVLLDLRDIAKGSRRSLQLDMQETDL